MNPAGTSAKSPADGAKSHNLFGIKAAPAWKGKTVEC